MQALVEGFECPFAADSVSEEHGHKVNHLVVAEATPGKAHALTDGGKDTLAVSVLGNQGTSPNLGGVEGTDWEEVWIITDHEH
jgi:hypothetical protein